MERKKRSTKEKGIAKGKEYKKVERETNSHMQKLNEDDARSENEDMEDSK
jgi:hypothetical protein